MGNSTEDFKRYRAYKASGVCVSCGVDPASGGTTQCGGCRKDSAGRHQKRRERLKAEGMCGACLRNKPAPGMKMCASCRILGAAAARKRADKVRAPEA